MKKQVNQFWADPAKTVVISVITPVYNRRDLLPRAMKSVAQSEFRDIEYVIVNDGSEEFLDDIVSEFMNSADFPVAYLTKENGGVHTARNAGIREARGAYILCLDSDDEILPQALGRLIEAWSEIPETVRDQYREVVCQSMDQNGHRSGTPFPDGINDLSKEKASAACGATGGDHISLQRADILKANLFPEPEGVTFIPEGILWTRLNQLYRSWYINDMLRIYHQETEVSYSNAGSRPKTLQYVINSQWEYAYYLNHPDIYRTGIGTKLSCIIKYAMFSRILPQDLAGRYPLKRTGDKALKTLCAFPCHILAEYYKAKKMAHAPA